MECGKICDIIKYIGENHKLNYSEYGGVKMVLENRLGITDSAELARTEEKISKQKALTVLTIFMQNAVCLAVSEHCLKQVFLIH